MTSIIIKRIVFTALIIALASFAWINIEYMVGLHTKFVEYHPYVTNLIFLFYIWVYYKFINRLATTISPFELKHGILSGAIIGLLSALLSLPLLWCYFEFINTEFFDLMIAAALKKALIKNDSVVVALNEARSYFNLKSYLMQSVLFNIVAGLLLSLLFSYRIVKRNK
jgi:hypothetical protein